MKDTSFLTAENVTLRVRDRRVVENLSWDIKINEHWAILGPNGAGKTTLAKSLFGGVSVVGGRITHHFEKEHPIPSYNAIGYVSPEQQRGIFKKENMQLDLRDYSGNLDEITTVEDVILERAYR